MAAAIDLSRRGVTVDLIDLDPDWRVYGAGITITGPTLRAYRHLGMVDDIAANGAITNGTSIYRYDGTHLQNLDEPAIEQGLPVTAGIMRPILHRLMQERVIAAGVSVRLGLTVTGLESDSDGVSVRFSDGNQGRYDLVIGADSIFSGVREIAFPHMGRPRHTGQACWRISMGLPPEMDRGEFYLGHQFPVGITRCGEDNIYMWMLTPHKQGARHFDDQELFDNMRANLAGFGGNAGWVRDNMTTDDWINYRPLEARIQPRSWSNGRIVLIGDAVHATTPHLASGAGMAVESAIVLAQELANTNNVTDALTAYEERRFDRCRDVVETSIAVGELQLSGGDPGQVGQMIGSALHRLAQPF